MGGCDIGHSVQFNGGLIAIGGNLSIRSGLVALVVGTLATAIFTAMTPAPAQQGKKRDKPVK